MKQPISQEELFLPLLLFLADHGGEIDRARDDLLNALADRLGLSTAERERTTRKGRGQWRADVEFCRQKLIEYWGALQSTAESGWGIWKLSDAGEEIVENPPRHLLEKFNGWTRARLRSLPPGATKPPERPTGYSDVRLAQIRDAVGRSRNEQLREKREAALNKATHEESDHSASALGNDTSTEGLPPSQYRPVPRRPRERRNSIVGRSQNDGALRRAVPIEVRIVIQSGGFCRISLLARRSAGQADRVAVAGTGNPETLRAMQEEWYEDVVLDGMGDLLRRGVEWRLAHAGEGGRRWTLHGRDVYVLGKHPSVNGFVTTPRLIIGEEHVVLCSAERLPDVIDAIALTGSPAGSRMDPERGAPEGWVVLRGIVPTRPVPQSRDGNTIDALRPVAEAEIILEGGIRIGRGTWLCGYPPRIRLRGDTAAVNRVLIDAQEATLGSGANYEAPSWDSPGEHSVWCESGSRSYTISFGLETWEPWEAFPWLIGDLNAERPHNDITVCGILIRPAGAPASGVRTILAPESNTLLVGAAPGEICKCQRRSDVRASTCVGYPLFDPVWALPLNPLRVDKRTCAVLALADSGPGTLASAPVAMGLDNLRVSRESLESWCRAILDAGRKGLRVEPPDVGTRVLWNQYKQTARSIWRQLR